MSSLLRMPSDEMYGNHDDSVSVMATCLRAVEIFLIVGVGRVMPGVLATTVAVDHGNGEDDYAEVANSSRGSHISSTRKNVCNRSWCHS